MTGNGDGDIVERIACFVFDIDRKLNSMEVLNCNARGCDGQREDAAAEGRTGGGGEGDDGGRGYITSDAICGHHEQLLLSESTVHG
jgi:hypothetical protein